MASRYTGVGAGDSGERVVSNYHTFLSALAKKQEGAFISVHQQLDEGNETTRVHQLMALEKDHANIGVLVQPVRQGDLGKKEGRYVDAKTFEELRIAVIENFFTDEEKDFSRCQLPTFIREDRGGYGKVMEDMMNFINQTYFMPDDDFSKAETWHEFLMIFYFYQRHDLMFRFQEKSGFRISYTTTPCKDFLDRGVNIALTHASLMAAITGELESEEWMKDQVAHTVGPPLATKRQGVIPKKLEFFRNFHTRIARVYQTPELIAEVRGYKFAEKWSVNAYTRVKKPDQKAFPDLAEIRTTAEMKERLKWLSTLGKEPPKVVPAELLLAGIGHGAEVREDTTVIFNETQMTVGRVLEESVDHKDRILDCLKLAMNGIMEARRKEMVDALERTEHGLILGDKTNLVYKITTKSENEWVIHMRWDHPYIAVEGVKRDGRFAHEEFNLGHEFATVQVGLSLTFDPTSGNVLGDGSSAWQVIQVN